MNNSNGTYIKQLKYNSMVSKWDYLVRDYNYTGSLTDQLAQRLIDSERSQRDIMFWNKGLRKKIKDLEKEIEDLKLLNKAVSSL